MGKNNYNLSLTEKGMGDTVFYPKFQKVVGTLLESATFVSKTFLF
jgi:hypothetical protein